MLRTCLLLVVLLASLAKVQAQCGSSTPNGNQTDYGANQWYAYVYDGIDNFTNYQGYLVRAQNFDENFGAADGTFAVSGACNVDRTSFTVRFRMQLAVPCPGDYTFTIGADDGVRLSIDGGSTQLINDYSDHGYRTTTTTVTLAEGSYNMVLDFYENAGENRVSFNMTNTTGGSGGGVVAGSQTICSNNPDAFTSTNTGFFCGGSTYQWQESTNNVTFTNIGGATAAIYDIPAGVSTGTRYYRRALIRGASTLYSNTLTVTVTLPLGDQVTYGTNAWIGYVYDGRDNFASGSYQGYVNELQQFDQSFCGDNCLQTINGCSIQTETFSVRYRMRVTLPPANYTFTIGADDGVRLSINGGSTYLVSDYSDHAYQTVTSAAVALNGTYDFVLDFFENGGGNRVSFSYTSTPLPVTLTTFTGSTINNQNRLEWVTASEENNMGFSIEKSFDGTNFRSVGWVDGQGTTNEMQRYTFVDEKPYKGLNYYRLRQQDFDGAEEYSKIIRLDYYTKELYDLFPNPANDEITISYSGATPILKVLSLDGKVVNPKILHQPQEFILSGLDPGVYLVNLTSEAGTERIKFIVVP